MSKPTSRLVLWGSSGHAMVVADIVRSTGVYEIAGMLDDLHPERRGQLVAGAPILGGREQLPLLLDRGVTHIILAIGDCSIRARLARLAVDGGFALAIAVHARAVVAPSATLGAGTVVAAGAVVNPNADIGSNCIVNTSASVDHDCVIGSGVHVGPGVHIGGGTHVGPGTWLGIGATLIDHVRVGARSIVGAGSVVTRDVPDGVVVYGVPARFVRQAGPGEPEP